VMSKKIAEGSDALVLDVKCGSGAFMKTADQARSLAQSLVAIGRAHGMRTEAFITSMDAPLGNAVGNALEIAECVETLQGKGPSDLEAVVVRLASRMVELGGGAANASEAESRVRDALASGAGLEKFSTMIARQGGDASITRDHRRLPRAEHVRQVVSPGAGFLRTLDAELVGRASMLLGAGREKVGDSIDPGAGIMIAAKPGAAVAAGQPILELRYNDGRRLDEAVRLAEAAITIGDAPVDAAPLILDHIR